MQRVEIWLKTTNLYVLWRTEWLSTWPMELMMTMCW